jgi:hypothetical protein
VMTSLSNALQVLLPTGLHFLPFSFSPFPCPILSPQLQTVLRSSESELSNGPLAMESNSPPDYPKEPNSPSQGSSRMGSPGKRSRKNPGNRQWLKKASPNDNFTCLCLLCNKTFSCKNDGGRAVVSYEDAHHQGKSSSRHFH